MNSFHGYALEQKIGSGGMSTVYMGHHETLGYPVAVKVLHPSMSGDQGFIARFELEARAASSLHHNNIINVLDFGSENDIYFIIMQYIEGYDLGKIFRNFTTQKPDSLFPLEIGLLMLEEVAYGLKAAHLKGIVHRDIKPSNVMLSLTGDVKLADFGLARDVSCVGGAAALDLTLPGTIVGTPSYMSPEQAAGDKVDTRTDIFSLGVMAYQLIMGQKPFRGETPQEVQECIINATLPTFSPLNCPRYTQEIDHLLTKMLAKDPSNRFQGMDQVLRALVAAQESIDPSGNTLKYKRDYLARFAENPVEFAVELRDMAINGYLKRGYFYKNKGLSSINDAVREFSHVVSIDSQHTKARAELRELQDQAEESGVSLEAAKSGVGPAANELDGDLTRVLSSDIQVPGQARGAEQPSSAEESHHGEQTQVIGDPTPPPAPEVAEAHEKEQSAVGKTNGRPLIWGSLAIAILAAAGWFFMRPATSDDNAPQESAQIAPDRSEESVTGTDNSSVSTGDPATEALPTAAMVTALETARSEMEAARNDKLLQGIDSQSAANSWLDRAEAARSEAETAVSEERYEDARPGFEKATGLFGEAANVLAAEKEKIRKDALAAAAQSSATAQAEATKARSAMNSAKNKAKSAGGQHYAEDIYRAGVAKEVVAEESFKSGGTDGFDRAKRQFGDARKLFARAETQAVSESRLAELALARRKADEAKADMQDVSSRLADYPVDLLNSSPAIAQANLAVKNGVQAYETQDYAQAQDAFTAARDSFLAAEPELRRLRTDYERKAAVAAIENVVNAFYSSVKTNDLDSVAATLKLNDDDKDAYSFILDNLDSLEENDPDVTFRNVDSAEVRINTTIHYRSRGAQDKIEEQYVWDMKQKNGQWVIDAVRRE